MGNSKFTRLVLALLLALTLALVACGANDDNDSSADANEPDAEEATNDDEEASEDGEELTKAEEVLGQFVQSVSNTDEPIEGGELVFGLVSNDPFKGTLNWNFYDGAPDAEVIKWFDEALLGTDGDFLYDDTGIATFEHDEDGKVFTFTLEEGVTWHDGEPLTVEDWVFAHEVIADPDYTGVRFDSTLRNVEGIEDYNAGEADEISGLEIVDDHTLKMTFVEANPSLLAGGIWPYALPKHIFGDIPVAEMDSSDAVRKNPVGLGPYKVDSIVPGESVVYTKNEDYWRGEPNLDKVTLKVVAPTTVAQALETGEVDMVDDFPVDAYPDNKDMSNVEFLARVDNAYNYIGFKLGSWDNENAVIVPTPEESKMGDVELRRAMAHAIDGDALGEEFYNNLSWGANSLIDPGHRLYHDPEIEGFVYDLDKANEILDDAGYTERDGDDFRLTPDGEELEINFAAMDNGTTISEPLADYFVQQWREIGLNVQLVDGRLLGFEDFYDRVGNGEEDDPNIDVYAGGWGTGSNVDPSGLYGPEAKFNFSRYQSDENERLLEAGLSQEAFDLEYRKSVYADWVDLMIEDVPVFPTLFHLEVRPVNNRVTNYSMDPDVDSFLYEIGVTEEEPELAN